MDKTTIARSPLQSFAISKRKWWLLLLFLALIFFLLPAATWAQDDQAAESTDGSGGIFGLKPTDPAGPIAVLIALSLAAVLGAVQAVVYKYTLTGNRLFRPQMAYTLLLLCIGGALIWLVIGNNLVRAFGLGGALALIRYRTRVRDPKDMPLVLFAMIIGMACGLTLYYMAAIGTFFIALVLVIIKIDWSIRFRRDQETPLDERPEVIDAWDDET